MNKADSPVDPFKRPPQAPTPGERTRSNSAWTTDAEAAALVQTLLAIRVMNTHTNTPQLGAITHRRALRADDTERVCESKTFRISGRHGGASTLDMPVDDVYAWMCADGVSIADIRVLLRDAANLLRRSPPTSSGRYLSWAHLVRTRALKLSAALAGGMRIEDILFSEQNNAAVAAQLESTG